MSDRAPAARRGASVARPESWPQFDGDAGPQCRGSLRRWAVALLGGGPSAVQEVGWLLRAALGDADPTTPVSRTALAEFVGSVARRRDGEPLAYVLGSAPFLDFELAVDPAVLIPRGETELLARWATARLEAGPRVQAEPDAATGTGAPPIAGAAAGSGALTIADVGTGSGALAIALARAFPPGTRVVATDTSRAALAVAARNVEALGVSGVELVAVDLLPPHERYDLVVANLPYVGRAEMAWVDHAVARYEPAGALFPAGEPLTLIRRLVRRLLRQLAPEGAVGLEIGWRQAPAVLALCRATWPRAAIRLYRDAAGRPRVVTADLANSRATAPKRVEVR